MCGRYAPYGPILAASILAALWSCSASRVLAPNPSRSDGQTKAVDAFKSALIELAGPHATECGHESLGADQSSAVECAQAEVAAGRSFWVAVQVEGVDSILWRGAARGPTGAAWLVTFDSDVHGGGANSPNARPALARTPCLRLDLSISDPQHVSCAAAAGVSEVVPLSR
jgi:hypothetical protein